MAMESFEDLCQKARVICKTRQVPPIDALIERVLNQYNVKFNYEFSTALVEHPPDSTEYPYYAQNKTIKQTLSAPIFGPVEAVRNKTKDAVLDTAEVNKHPICIITGENAKSSKTFTVTYQDAGGKQKDEEVALNGHKDKKDLLRRILKFFIANQSEDIKLKYDLHNDFQGVVDSIKDPSMAMPQKEKKKDTLDSFHDKLKSAQTQEEVNAIIAEAQTLRDKTLVHIRQLRADAGYDEQRVMIANRDLSSTGIFVEPTEEDIGLDKSKKKAVELLNGLKEAIMSEYSTLFTEQDSSTDFIEEQHTYLMNPDWASKFFTKSQPFRDKAYAEEVEKMVEKLPGSIFKKKIKDIFHLDIKAAPSPVKAPATPAPTFLSPPAVSPLSPEVDDTEKDPDYGGSPKTKTAQTPQYKHVVQDIKICRTNNNIKQLIELLNADESFLMANILTHVGEDKDLVNSYANFYFSYNPANKDQGPKIIPKFKKGAKIQENDQVIDQIHDSLSAFFFDEMSLAGGLTQQSNLIKYFYAGFSYYLYKMGTTEFNSTDMDAFKKTRKSILHFEVHEIRSQGDSSVKIVRQNNGGASGYANFEYEDFYHDFLSVTRNFNGRDRSQAVTKEIIKAYFVSTKNQDKGTPVSEFVSLEPLRKVLTAEVKGIVLANKSSPKKAKEVSEDEQQAQKLAEATQNHLYYIFKSILGAGNDINQYKTAYDFVIEFKNSSYGTTKKVPKWASEQAKQAIKDNPEIKT